MADYYSPWSFKSGRNGLCSSLFLWKVPKQQVTDTCLPIHLDSLCNRRIDYLKVMICTLCVEYEEGQPSKLTKIPWALEAAQLKEPTGFSIAPHRGSNPSFTQRLTRVCKPCIHTVATGQQGYLLSVTALVVSLLCCQMFHRC